MTEEQRLKRNAYHRQWYELNLEKQRKKQLEKYHRNKKLYCDLTDEEREIKKQKNRKNYENWLIRQGKEVRVQKQRSCKVEKEKKIEPKTKKITKPKKPMKKLKLPSRITHKYVSDVLRKFPKSRLCNILIAKWTLAELKEFELLEEEFNKSAN